MWCVLYNQSNQLRLASFLKNFLLTSSSGNIISTLNCFQPSHTFLVQFGGWGSISGTIPLFNPYLKMIFSIPFLFVMKHYRFSTFSLWSDVGVEVTAQRKLTFMVINCKLLCCYLFTSPFWVASLYLSSTVVQFLE